MGAVSLIREQQLLQWTLSIPNTQGTKEFVRDREKIAKIEIYVFWKLGH